ncbi:MAG: signal peptidase [Pseudomonadota bacterium]|jgi:signal peptidase II
MAHIKNKISSFFFKIKSLRKNLKKERFFFIFAIIIALIDLVSKHKIFNKFLMGRYYYNVNQYFNLTAVKNYGVSFGMFNKTPTALLILINIILVSYIIYLIIKQDNKTKHITIFKTGLATILGGAIGNILDRIVNGYVRDFLDFHYKTHHWPAFNIADIAVCCGVLMIIIFDLIQKNTK